MITVGRAIAVALCIFDVVLGSVAAGATAGHSGADAPSEPGAEHRRNVRVPAIMALAGLLLQSLGAVYLNIFHLYLLTSLVMLMPGWNHKPRRSVNPV